MTDGEMEMLLAAVMTAKAFQCSSVQTLTMRLQDKYPGREDDIAGALKHWARAL